MSEPAGTASQHHLHHHRPAALRHHRRAGFPLHGHAEPGPPGPRGRGRLPTASSAGASCVPSRASLFTRPLSAHHRRPARTATCGGILGRVAGRRRATIASMSARCTPVPFKTPLGFHERYVVENKDRYLEARYFFDEWDKALRGRGLVKQQRETLSPAPRLPGAAWAPSSGSCPRTLHSDMFVGRYGDLVDRTPTPRTEPLFLQVGFPGPHPPYDPIPRYAEPYLERKDLPLAEVPAGSDLGAQPPSYQAMRAAQCRGGSRFAGVRSSHPTPRGSSTASAPTTWPT